MTPVTCAGKLFAAMMAFLSVGFVVASLGFLLGPFLGMLWKIGVMRLEEDRLGTRNRKKWYLPQQKINFSPEARDILKKYGYKLPGAL